MAQGKCRRLIFLIGRLLFLTTVIKMVDIVSYLPYISGVQIFHWVDVDGYAYLVPCVPTDDGYFLKTIIPSRKATRKYFGGSHE